MLSDRKSKFKDKIELQTRQNTKTKLNWFAIEMISDRLEHLQRRFATKNIIICTLRYISFPEF